MGVLRAVGRMELKAPGRSKRPKMYDEPVRSLAIAYSFVYRWRSLSKMTPMEESNLACPDTLTFPK